MDYLFTERDTVLVFSFLVYGGLAFFQLQKMLILSQFGQSFSVYQSIWIVGRTILVIPLLWTVKCLT
ncbi:MAG: hypothetical protein ACFCU5_20330 [Pleurocapsa sp.]